MKKHLTYLILISLVFTLFTDLSAIPAFARKYSMSCQTCHSPFPKIKPYGDEFAGNGFVLSDKDAPRYFIETGDSELSLIRDLPLALRMELYGTYQNRKNENNDFKTPYILKFMSGGALTKDVAYYFYFFFSERGEVAGIEDAFIMFNNLFDTELDLYVGQFQVSDPLFKRELRLTLEDYQPYKALPGLSKAGLTYDRGIMLTYGFETGTDLIFEILTGNGIGAANEFKNFDNDKYKNFMLRASQDLSDFARVGAFAYYGKEKLEDINGLQSINEINNFGGDFTITLGDKFEINGQYTYRTDKHPLPSLLNPDKIKTEGVFSEVIYTPNGDESKFYGVGLFNYVKSDFNELNYKSGTLHLGYMLKRNIRLISEYTYNITKEYGLLSVGIVSAF
jgi:hypothetical protein